MQTHRSETPSDKSRSPLAPSRHDTFAILQKIQKDFGDFVTLPAPKKDMIITNHPEIISHILKSSPEKYQRIPSHPFLQALMGKSLITAEGPSWKNRRLLIFPFFHKKNIQNRLGIFVEETEKFLSHWHEKTLIQESLNLCQEIQSLAQNVILKTIFSPAIRKYFGSFQTVYQETIEILTQMDHSDLFPSQCDSSGMQTYRTKIGKMDEYLFELMKVQTQIGLEGNDFLSYCLRKINSSYEFRDIRDDILTILFAGFETSANALLWILFLLGKYPEKLNLIQKNPLYAHWVVAEALRLYPSVYFISKRALCSEEVLGKKINEGCTVVCNLYGSHRHPEFWPNADQFLPERFAPKKSEKFPVDAYFPFGLGPHQCLGKSFALNSFPILVIRLAQNYTLNLTSTPSPKIRGKMALYPDPDIFMGLKHLG